MQSSGNAAEASEAMDSDDNDFTLKDSLRQLVERFGIEACQQAWRDVIGAEKVVTATINNDESNDTRDSKCFHQQQSIRPQHQQPTNTMASLEEAMLDAAFDCMFLTDVHGTIVRINRATQKTLGYTADDELVGKNISIVIGGGHSDHHAGYLSAYQHRHGWSIPGVVGYKKQRQLTVRRADGSEFPCLMGLQVIGRGNKHPDDDPSSVYYFCSLRDVTADRERAALLKTVQREKHLRETILQASLMAFVTTDRNGNIQYANRAALQTLGYGQLVGKNVSVLCGGAYRSQHAGFVERFWQTREKRILGTPRRVPVRRQDGTEFPAVFGIQLVEDDREPIFVAFIRDVTAEEQKMALEIEQRAAQELLLNMLPAEIVARLQAQKKKKHEDAVYEYEPGSVHMADHFDHATVLFADITGFTHMSSQLSPLQVVEMLNDLFSRFDLLVDKYQLNKVKTIG